MSIYVNNPKLRNGSKLIKGESSLVIEHIGEEFEILPDNDTSLEEIASFLEHLDGSLTVDELKNKMNNIPSEKIDEFLEVLDEEWLLSEGAKKEIIGKTGLEFFMELEDIYKNWERESGETQLTSLVLSGKASENVIVGWTFEYYHITKIAHQSISPTIAKANNELRPMFIDFFLEEYRHDLIIGKALKSIGYEQEELDSAVPLPYTLSVGNILAKWAHTDLLSFMASLFIYEGTPVSGDEYIDAISTYNFPKEFAAHQSTHNDINKFGDHGNVSRDFYSKVKYISPEDQLRVIKNIRMLHETNLKAHEAVLEYYSNPSISIPRSITFDTKISFV